MVPGALPMMETEEWREQFAAHVFRTKDSMKYFLRTHREELVEAGALVAPAGRLLVHPKRFEAVVQQIGQRMAASRTYSRRGDLQ
jgi:hypothetical protein